ncbi:MAG TPA: GTP 3',8-cyclase MoaA [Terriglobia bacterium]|nr:GTP 3',8-cyclase MoaA [Terriglobia bacterium]
MASANLERGTPVLDRLYRPLRSLRISVTDRCNLRCAYCMPEDDYLWLDHKEILTFEEIAWLVEIFTGLGVEKIRLTGGEPLLRRDLDRLVRLIAANSRVRDLALTTNGVQLRRDASALRAAGLERVTVSLDTLDPGRFRALTRSDRHADVLDGIAAAREAGFGHLKLNAVIIRGFNDDELPAMIEFGRRAGAEVRFIEYMDVGGATRWSSNQVVSRADMLAALKHRFGPITPEENGSDAVPAGGFAKAPADQFRLPDGTRFGIISSTTQPFCRTCDRARLTPDGMLLLCLYAVRGIDLKRLLRQTSSPGEITPAVASAIASAVSNAWRERTDRGAEERLALGSRGVLFQIEDLRQDPHREMHTRGG